MLLRLRPHDYLPSIDILILLLLPFGLNSTQVVQHFGIDLKWWRGLRPTHIPHAK